jgi:hypothetical protein
LQRLPELPGLSDSSPGTFADDPEAALERLGTDLAGRHINFVYISGKQS